MIHCAAGRANAPIKTEFRFDPPLRLVRNVVVFTLNDAGKPRSYRFDKQIAIESAQYLKREPNGRRERA